MALTRPALDILGISPGFARIHPTAVVIAVADAIYRTAASRYHPDKGDEALPLPSGVNLTELQEARDAVRNNPRTCIKEAGRGERTSREGKLAGELTARVSVLEEADDAWSQSATALWDFIAREKLGLKIDEEMMGTKIVAYSTLHLDGVAILVATGEHGKSIYHEYLRHDGVWFERPVVKASFSKKTPCPPGIPPELISESIAIGGEQGSFYDQSGPHVMHEGFEVLGSYRKADLAKARAQKRKIGGKKTAKATPSALSVGSPFKVGAHGLDPLVASVLKPSVSAGSVLQAVIRGADGHVRYFESGIITSVRMFDQKQRP